MNALTLGIVNHERLVRGARALMAGVSGDIRRVRPTRLSPLPFALLLGVQTGAGGRIVIHERMLPLPDAGQNQAQECAVRLRDASDRATLAACVYLVGGDATGKELQVVGKNLVGEIYALARPIRRKHGALLVGGKPRPIQGDAPPLVVDILRLYLDTLKGEWL